MRITMIVPYPIYPPDEGGRVRAYNLLKHLSREHEVSLLTPRSPRNTDIDLPIAVHETTSPGRRRQIFSPGFLGRATRALRDAPPDRVMVEYPWPGLHGWRLARRFGAQLVLDAPNVEAVRFRSAGSRMWPAVALYERLVTRLASRVFAVSGEDARRFVARGVRPEKITVVPNGVDPDVMHPDGPAGAAARASLDIAGATRLLLFFGQLDYAPNRQALAVIAAELMPRLDAAGAPYEVVVAGKGDLDALRRRYAHPRLRFVGAVPNIAPLINAADAVIVPVVSGGGTRLKVLESIACGVPVVATSAGAEGIDRALCGHLLHVEDAWDAFASRAATVVAAGPRAAPAGFLDRYSWEAIVSEIKW